MLIQEHTTNLEKFLPGDLLTVTMLMSESSGLVLVSFSQEYCRASRVNVRVADFSGLLLCYTFNTVKSKSDLIRLLNFPGKSGIGTPCCIKILGWITPTTSFPCPKGNENEVKIYIELQ